MTARFAERKPAGTLAWAEETAKAHATYLEWSTPPQTGPGAVRMGPIMNYLEKLILK